MSKQNIANCQWPRPSPRAGYRPVKIRNSMPEPPPAITWRDDAELFRLIRAELYTPVVGDVLDTLGFTRQFLPQPVQPMRESMVVVGRAMPVLMIDVHGPQAKPFGKLTDAL